MNKTDKTILILCGAVIFGVLWRLFYLWQFSESPLFSHPAGPDTAEYDRWAREIIGGQWLWKNVHIHAPLYPYFLALLYWVTGYDFFWVRFIQLLLGMAGAIPVYLGLCRGQWRNLNPTALTFAAIVLVYPPLIYYQAELICEVLLLPLLALSWYLLRRKAYLGSGLAAGLAAITHPGSLIFIVGEVVLLAVYPRRRAGRTRRALFFLLGSLLFIAPVVGYNSWLAERPVPIQANGGMNFYLGHNVETNGTCYLRPGPEWEHTTRWVATQAELTGRDMDRVYTESALRFIMEHPFTFVRLSVRKAVLVWNWRELIAGADAEPLRYFTAFQRYSCWAFIIPGILGLSGLVCVLIKRHRLFVCRHVTWWLMSFWLLQVITVTSGRYRVAMLYPIFMFGALLLNKFIRGKRLRPVPLTLLIGGAAALVMLPQAPFDVQSERIEAASILAESYYAAGNRPKAAEHIRFVLEQGRDLCRSNNFLGTLYLEPDPGYAKACFMKAIEADPLQGEGYMNMGILKTRTGEFAAAEDYFRLAGEAYISHPDDYLYNRGYFHEIQGNIDRALKDYRAAMEYNPGNRKALNAAGVIHFRRQETAAAADYFRRALALEPENVGVMLNLAAVAVVSGDKAGALRQIEKARKIDPESAGIRSFLDMMVQ
jgi:Tfp pilus assembly protein PilF